MNPKSCGLCFEQILNGAFENLDFEKMQNLLSVLNLDIVDVKQSKEATVCSVCADMSQRLFNFRTACLNTNDPLKSLDHHCAEELILEDTIVKNAKSIIKCENGKVCRFCLKYIEENSVTEVKMEQDTVIKDMLMKCIPELDVNIVKETCICYECIESLEKCCNFILRCEDNELVKFLRKKTKQVTVVSNKKTNLSMGNAEDDIYDSFMKKEENCIQIEETKLQINVTEKLADEASKESLIEILDESDPLENTIVIGSTPFDGNAEKLFSCHRCSYSTNLERNLISHYLVHSGEKKVRQFKCEKCPYVAKRKANLVSHLVVHEEHSKRKIYNCSECTFKSLNKFSIRTHNTNVHGNTDDRYGKLKTYICYECNFETMYRTGIVAHLRSHQMGKAQRKKKEQLSQISNNKEDNETEIPSFPSDLLTSQHSNQTIYKCIICGRICKYKTSLWRHIRLDHMNNEDLDLHMCKDCNYRAVKLCHLEQHYIKKHNKFVGEIFYSCKECDFREKDKIEFLLHKQAH